MTEVPGRVRRFDITDRQSPSFGGNGFGAVGPYEQLSGRAYCELDPLHRLNRDILNLDLVPRNGRGMVEYVVDVNIVKPVDTSRGNGWLFHEVLNRGSKRAIHRINDAPAANVLAHPDHAGNGYLMREGYTLLWVGWQGDVPAGGGRMLADLPVPQRNGEPMIGLCRDEIIADGPGTVRDEVIAETTDTTFTAVLSYTAATLDPARASLTVRQNERDPRATPPDLTWRYLGDRQIEVTRPAGFDRGAIYEFIFPARDPTVMGIGFAAVRDVVSFVRHADADEAGGSNPLAGTVKHALLFGLSQSGRMIRDFLYQGFNEGPRGTAVFEAMMPVIAGSRRMFMNHAFAQPSRYPRQHEDHAYPGDQFPFTYTTLTDAISGRTDGLLERARQAGVVPKIMQIDTDSEVWSARASLVVTDTDGDDIDLPEEVRVYVLAGLQHGSYKPPSPKVVQLPPNPLTYGSQLRALLAAMLRWVEGGTLPPASRFPSRRAGTLMNLDEARAKFPLIDGVTFPAVVNVVRLMDHTQEPPAEGPAYPVFVAATDADGNGIDGVRHPLILAPLGTHTGWNLRAANYAEGELYSIAGSMIPFAQTSAEREPGDPRLSVEERYESRAGFLTRIEAACATLIAAGFLLREDRDRLVTAVGEGARVLTAI